jgi:hypothetical protein
MLKARSRGTRACSLSRAGNCRGVLLVMSVLTLAISSTSLNSFIHISTCFQVLIILETRPGYIYNTLFLALKHDFYRKIIGGCCLDNKKTFHQKGGGYCRRRNLALRYRVVTRYPPCPGFSPGSTGSSPPAKTSQSL